MYLFTYVNTPQNARIVEYSNKTQRLSASADPVSQLADPLIPYQCMTRSGTKPKKRNNQKYEQVQGTQVNSVYGGK